MSRCYMLCASLAAGFRLFLVWIFYVHTCSRDLEATLSMHHTSHRSMIRQSDTLFLLNLSHKSIDFHEVREYYTSWTQRHSLCSPWFFLFYFFFLFFFLNSFFLFVCLNLSGDLWFRCFIGIHIYIYIYNLCSCGVVVRNWTW